MKIRIEDEKFVYLQFTWNTDVVIDERGVTFPGFVLMNARPVITKSLKNLTVTIEPHIVEDLDPDPAVRVQCAPIKVAPFRSTK